MSAGAIYAGAVAASAVILGAAAREAADTGPNYIRDGQPDGIVKRLGLGIARAACRRYAENPSVVQGKNIPLYETACRPYLKNIGYGDGPSLGKPFAGGQCPVNYNARVLENGTPRTISIGARGPIASASIQVLTGNSWRVSGVGALGPWASSTQFGPPSAVSLSAMVRQDGQPDTCGDPAPIYGPPPPQPPSVPNPEPFNPAPNINVNLGVVLVAPGAIQVNIGLQPEITVDPFGDDGGGGGGGGNLPPGDIGDPGTPEDTGMGGDAEGEAPEGEILTGIKISFASPPVGGNEYAEGIYRGVCYIYMGTAEGLDHDPAGAMLRDGQFVFAEKDNLTRWAVNANMGYNLRVTPYYRPAAVEGE